MKYNEGQMKRPSQKMIKIQEALLQNRSGLEQLRKSETVQLKKKENIKEMAFLEEKLKPSEKNKENIKPAI